MELPVRIGRRGVVKSHFQNGNLRLVQIKGEEMLKGCAEYKHHISNIVNIVCFAVDICWTILYKTFLETDEKRITLSGSPWPKWSDGNYTRRALKPSSRDAFITLCEAVNCFSSLSMSFCPWSLSSLTPPRESLDTSYFWRALSSGPQRNNCFSFLLPQSLSWWLCRWCELRRAQDEGMS